MMVFVPATFFVGHLSQSCTMLACLSFGASSLFLLCMQRIRKSLIASVKFVMMAPALHALVLLPPPLPRVSDVEQRAFSCQRGESAHMHFKYDVMIMACCNFL